MTIADGKILDGAPGGDAGADHANSRFRVKLLGAGLLWSIGLLIVNMLPLFFQAVGARGALAESHLGSLGALFVLGTALSTGGSPLWIRRVNWRWTSICGLVATSAGVVGTMFAPGFGLLAACFFLMGAASGIVQTPSFAVLGDAGDPVRTFSIALFASMLMPAILSLALPEGSSSTAGGAGLLAPIAALFLIVLPFAWALPGRRAKAIAPTRSIGAPTEPHRHLRDYGPAAWAPIVASIAGGLFTGVIMAVYNFVGSIAAANGLSPDMTGTLVGLGLLGALVGSLLPSVLGRRISPTLGLALSVLCLAVFVYPAMLSSSPLIFTVAFVFDCVFATIGFAYFLAMVRSVDPTHRIYVAYPALQSAGIAAATAIAGQLLTHFNPAMLFLVAGTCLVMSWLTWVLALKLAARFPVAVSGEMIRTS